MRISLVTIGSRGDIQPFVALGASLKSRGHDVTFATTADFGWMAEEAGLAFRALPGDPGAILKSPEVIAAIRKGPSTTRIAVAARKLPQSQESDPEHGLDAVLAAIEGADLVVANWMTKMACLVACPAVPWGELSTWPRVPTGRFPALGWPHVPLGAPYNRLTHWLTRSVEWLPARPLINRRLAALGRAALGMSSPFREIGRTQPVLFPFSPEVIPRPPDWPAKAHLTGYLDWDRDRPVDPGLSDFVATDLKPVVLTLGSLWDVYPEEEILRTVVAAARRAGRRVVRVGGRVEYAADDVYLATEVDYRWLLARSGFIVHHGGFGTTGEAIRAGVPQVALPSFSDQPYWSRVAHRLGVAVAPVPLTKLTEATLADALDTCLADGVLSERARDIGARVAVEKGNEAAAEIVENWA
ncbi:MAG TPA: nucleotide disphospho-sugar-binding domain-containing protein [Actinophytocola sp.]|nr:nucleotide disphospho-sugar-binding domain-containing protein [Actinophytocola sp.]